MAMTADRVAGASTNDPPAAVTAGRVRMLVHAHPLISLIVRRLLLGIVTLFGVSILIFIATVLLPGNAAYAVAGRGAPPARLHALEVQLHLNHTVIGQYLAWVGSLLHGNLGTSLAAQVPVTSLLGPRLENSLVLVVLAGAIAAVLGCLLGVLSAARRDSVLDHVMSVTFLGLTALPEFVVAIAVVMLFATTVWHVLPAVSVIAAGASVFDTPNILILPVASLVIIVLPYIFRMSRGAMIEALESEYAEMAVLKGASRRRLLLVHALPNAAPPILQVVGLNLLYLAGGIVVVETVFNYPGVGQGLVNAVAARDIPMIQASVLILAAFYIVVNITTDVLSLAASPRRRLSRS
jgi:peptide/nickel transport system permease protein